MIIEVDTQRATVALAESGVFTQFHISAPGRDITAVLATLGVDAAPAGEDHAWVSIDAVRRWADGDDAWEADFAGMLGYAAGKGWLNEDETMIRAHIEWAAGV